MIRVQKGFSFAKKNPWEKKAYERKVWKFPADALMNPETLARKIVEENLYMTIASSSRSRPWVSPVFFAHDSCFNFYWSSAKNSLHSRLIARNSSVAVVVFSSSAAEGTADALYMTGKASEIAGAEIERGLNLLFDRTGRKSKYFKGMKPADYTGNSPVRIYKFVPRRFWVLGKPVKVKGKLVDVRREVKLKK